MTIHGLLEAFSRGELTRDELFAAMTKVLSMTPALLREARAAVDFDPAVRSEFEAWLVRLRGHPAIALGGRRVAVTSELIAAMDAAERQPLGALPPRPTLRSAATTQLAELHPNA